MLFWIICGSVHSLMFIPSIYLVCNIHFLHKSRIAFVHLYQNTSDITKLKESRLVGYQYLTSIIFCRISIFNFCPHDVLISKEYIPLSYVHREDPDEAHLELFGFTLSILWLKEDLLPLSTTVCFVSTSS